MTDQAEMLKKKKQVNTNYQYQAWKRKYHATAYRNFKDNYSVS